MLERWFARPVTVLSCLLMLAALTLFFLPRLMIGQDGGEGSGWTVIIEHYGLDSEEIERSITEPLEAALMAVAGIREIRSVSEFGKVRVTIEKAQAASTAAGFIAIRDAVDRVWRRLPASVQKPQIFASSSRQSPVYILALEAKGYSENALRHWVELNLKPAMEKLEGAGEIEVAGGVAREAIVRLDEGLLSGRGLNYDQVAQAIQANQLLQPAGSVNRAGLRLPVVLDGRFSSLEALAELRLALQPSGLVRLGDLGRIEWAGREADSIARVNGERRVTLYVHAAGNANPVLLSRALRAQVAGLPAQGLDGMIIFDSGHVVEAGIQGILTAMLEGLLVVLLLLPLVMSSWRQVLGVALALPLALAFCLACLAALGITVDAAILAGLAVGVSSVLDSFIIVAEQPSLADMRRMLPSLVQSFLTVFIVMLPLALVDVDISGSRNMVSVISLMLASALLIACLFLPLIVRQTRLDQPHRLGRFPHMKRRISRRLARPAIRLIGRVVLFSSSHSWLVLVLAVGLCGLALWMAAARGVDFQTGQEDGSLFVHIEGEPEASLESMDCDTNQLWQSLKDVAGVSLGEITARQGNAQMTVRFDPAVISRAAVSERLRQNGQSIKGIFVYLPDSGGSRDTGFEIALSGDDDAQLRELAKQTARDFQQQPWVSQVVLNFKDPPEAVEIRVDHEHAAQAGLSARDIASRLRFSLYGPVVVKWFDQASLREYDLRLRGDQGSDSLTRSGLEGLSLGRGTPVRLATVANLGTVKSGAKLYHQNRQRVVYFTVQCQLGSLGEAARRIWQVLGRQALPEGYAFELDPRAQELESAFQRLWLALAIGVVLIYILLAGCTQSLRAPLVILSVAPPSMALPLIINSLSSGALRLPMVFGLIILAGIAVNSSILVMDEARPLAGKGRRTLAWRAIRSRIRPLALTTGAAVFGSLPLLFAPASAGTFLGSLSLVIMGGVLASMMAALTLLPALLSFLNVPIPQKPEEIS